MVSTQYPSSNLTANADDRCYPTTPGHSRAQNASTEEDFDAWAYSERGGAGSALLVKFEISIVKVCS